MPTNHILVDYENVQLENLARLRHNPKGLSFRILVFLGANQTKLPTEFAIEMQSFGSDANYIRISGNGKNALDFHIAYYLGTLAKPDSEDYFHVISKDTGFDPLIQHLQADNVEVERCDDLLDLSWIKAEMINTVVQKLKPWTSRPRKVGTLRTTINHLFNKSLSENQLDNLVSGLAMQGHIAIEDAQVAYKQETAASDTGVPSASGARVRPQHADANDPRNPPSL